MQHATHVVNDSKIIDLFLTVQSIDNTSKHPLKKRKYISYLLEEF